jgi:signal peptidase I
MKDGLSETLSTIGVILLAPVVALLMITFVFQSYQVDGPSMESTLQDGDRLIVTKYQKTWSRITRSEYIPQRYEIIVFNHQGDSSAANGEKQLIKRVVGLPGDRVVVQDGVVRVYNKENPDGYLVDQAGPEGNVIGSTPGNTDEVVQPGELYVLGDNRSNSLDSVELGPIRASDVVGELHARVFPFNKAQTF